jgi:hypothetical protein
VKHPRAEIKFIDCPILSIVNYNQYKGHDKPEIFKVEDFQVTRQIKALNSEIVITTTSAFNGVLLQLLDL